MKRRMPMSYAHLPARLRERVLLWLVTPFPTFFAILTIADLLDGSTRVIQGREATIWGDPGTFALATALCALVCTVAGLFLLAAISNWNEGWLPSWLRNRPHLATVLAIVATAVAVMMGLQLLDGQVTIEGRRSGLFRVFLGHHPSIDKTPVQFGLIVLAYLIACSAIAFGWVLTIRRWIEGPPKERWRPTFDDPTKRARVD